MSNTKKSETPELNIAGLLALKTYERPDANRVEKNIQNTMRAVRTTNNDPSLLLFPDKSFGWMVAQPRYGIAALFVIFLGMNLLNRPLPSAAPGSSPILKVPGVEIAAIAGTNGFKKTSVPGITPQAFNTLVGLPSPFPPYTE
ncbi:MAG: hypothetical protein HOO88_03755 [Kiritimatiellaceae bacterium]|nr:hypothetical protein [Kiritimatiellaceae bacterium]